MKIKILNKSIHDINGLPGGKTTEIETDKEGTPLDFNWRRRMRDAKIDGLIEIVKSEKKVFNRTVTLRDTWAKIQKSGKK